MNNLVHVLQAYLSRYTTLDPSMLRAISSQKGRLVAALLCFIIFTIKISGNRSLVNDTSIESDADAHVESFADRHNCQIIYILGVEGSMHHGFTPILETLARIQRTSADNAETYDPYVVSYAHDALRSALFGFSGELRTMDNPTLVKQTIRNICPRNFRKHVIIEDASFPSGLEDDQRTYRIHRQPWWSESTTSMEQIAMSEVALNHPTNLYTFYDAYSQYAEIKFIVLHRSYIETVASTFEQDYTAIRHSNVIRGFMLLLRRFLDTHPIDTINGQRLWTLVCVERIASKFYDGNEEQMNLARQNIITHLAEFLGWPETECPDCYSKWKDGTKNHLEVLGKKQNVAEILEHMRKLGGIWPPTIENALPEQKCSL